MRFAIFLIVAVIAASTYSQEIGERELEAAVDSFSTSRQNLIRMIIIGINENTLRPSRVIGVDGVRQDDVVFKKKLEQYRKRLSVKRKCIDLAGTFKVEEAIEALIQNILFSNDQKNATLEPSDFPAAKALVLIGKAATPAILKRLEVKLDEFPTVPQYAMNTDGTVTVANTINRHEASVLIWTLVRIEGLDRAIESLSDGRHRAALTIMDANKPKMGSGAKQPE